MSGQILIGDEIATHRIAMRTLLVRGRYDARSAADAGSVLAQVAAGDVELIILDADMALSDHAALIRHLKTDRGSRDIPVMVAMTGGNPDLRVRALQAGADDVAERPGRDQAFLARIRNQIRASAASSALSEREATIRDLGFAEAEPHYLTPARVALVAHDLERAERWRDALRDRIPHALHPLCITSAMEDMESMGRADIFVVEAPLTHPAESLELLADIRTRAQTRHAGVIVVHDPADTQAASIALDVGANDLIETGFHPEELALRLDRLLERKRMGDRLRTSVDEGLRLAMVDPLTGLFNRRYAMTHIARTIRDGGAYSLILADIDRFKSVNDRFGHGAGDDVLAAVARRLRENVRGMDMVARLGGEEFLIFLPDPDPDMAHGTAKRLRTRVRETPIELRDGLPPISVTASFGVATGRAGEALAAVMERADRALYRAKEAGRDRVTLDEAIAA